MAVGGRSSAMDGGRDFPFGVVITRIVKCDGPKKFVIFGLGWTPYAYLHVNCEDGDTYMKTRSKLAEIMILVDLKLYRKHVRYSSTSEAILYV